MNLLLDTHIFLWYITANPRLVDWIKEAIENPTNQVALSVVSFWEIVVKYQLGKLPLPDLPHLLVPAQRIKHQIESLPLTERDLHELPNLPTHHSDPFDRMLVCQCLSQNYTMVTEDAAIQQYAIPMLKP